MNKRYFSDNVLVKNRQYGGEFFSVTFGERISVTRYCVPGRIDIYSFTNEGGGHIRFYSDGWTLAEGWKLLQKDLARSNVCELLKRACEQSDWRGSARLMVDLLREFGNTKAYKAAKKAQEKTQAEYVASRAKKVLPE